MEEITIKRKDRKFDIIKEKMLEILDNYEEAKEQNNEEAMLKLEKYFNKQKSLMESSKEYFDSFDESDMKMQANYDTDIEKVKEAKYTLSGKKGYEKNNNLYDNLMNSTTMEEAKEILNKKPEKKRKFVFRKFKKQIIIGGLVAALAASSIGLISHFKKKNQDKKVEIETTTEYNDDTNSNSIQEESNFILNDESNLNEFLNENISVDESYKNLKYTGNGETISNNSKTNGVGTPSSIDSIEPKITETANENIELPQKPSDTISTVIIPEQIENNQIDESINEIPRNNDNNTTEKVTIEENEEVPTPSENNPSEIEESSTNTDNNSNNESETIEDVVIPPKPEENNPSKIEEIGDDEIIYFDEHGNPYTISNILKNQKNKEDTKNEEKTIIEEKEEIPSFEIPTEIEESKSSTTKEQYIALRNAIMLELAQNNEETESIEESQVLTYKM